MSTIQAPGRRAAALATMLAFVIAFVAPAAPADGAAAQKPESPITINHDELKCVTTEIPPQVDAAVAPGPQYEKGYVYFKAAGTEDFYYAPMKGQPENLAGVLPRPLPETKAIDYYVRATDVQDLSKKTQDYSPPVVPGNACKAKGVPPRPQGAGLTIGLTKEGQNPVPPGFNKKDIAYVILFSGATVAIALALKGAAGAAGGGGGVSSGVIVAGVAAAGAAVGIGASRGGKNTPTPPAPTSTPTTTPSATPTPTNPPLHFIVADATWSGEGDIDILILNASDQSVGSVIPAGCSPTTQRTERVVVNGVVPNGTYRVMITGKSCGGATPPQIAIALSVQSDSIPKCTTGFLNIPVGGAPVLGCTFTVP